MKNAYNVICVMFNRLATSQVWRWFCGLFKKKSNGVSLCKSEGIIVSLEGLQRIVKVGQKRFS